MKRYCPDVQLVGIIPKSPEKVIEQRYLGLRTLRSFAEKEIIPLQELTDPIDLDRVLDIVESYPVELPTLSPYTVRDCGLKAAVPMDDSYCFYYRENIECLETSGFRVETFCPTDGDPLPDADLYYLGGGYPELHADRLSSNTDFLEGLRSVSLEGKIVIGECGGLMTMCRSIRNKDGIIYRMSGVFDAEASMTGVRHGPTYVIADATGFNPVFAGTVRGHEYHYSDVFPSDDSNFGFDVRRGLGIQNGMDGLVSGNSIGSYMHQHALSERDWIGRVVDSISSRS